MRPPSRRARLRSHLRQILIAAIRAADPAAAVRRHVRVRTGTIRIGENTVRIRSDATCHVLALGKPASSMAQELADILGDRLHGGIVVTKHGHGRPVPQLDTYEGGHPIPDAGSVTGARAVIRYAETQVAPGDHVFVAIGGGASATACAPVKGVTLRDKQRVTDVLLRSGATIDEMNCVRKHLSALKGGRLGEALRHACVHTLLVSDVIGDDPATIGSGPTAPDPTTFDDALAIVDRYDLRKRIPKAAYRYLQRGSAGEIADTPKAAQRNHTCTVVLTNVDAVDAAAAQARLLGYRPLVLSTSIDGETRDAAGMHAAIVREIVARARPRNPPVAIISGGETTVTLGDATGQGGRNQEFVLAFVQALHADRSRWAVGSVGTDGTDGPTDVAGALADDRTLRRAAAAGLESAERVLAAHDSYPWFAALDDHVKTGPTATNVMDIRVVLVPDQH